LHWPRLPHLQLCIFDCKETDNIYKLYYFIYLLPLGYIDKTYIQWHGLSYAYRVVEFDLT
jgi:hypothetical protein